MHIYDANAEPFFFRQGSPLAIGFDDGIELGLKFLIFTLFQSCTNAAGLETGGVLL